MPKRYLAGAGATPGVVGTQIGAMHCMPAAQSAGPTHGNEHFPAATLHLWVRHWASVVQGKPWGAGFMPPAAGAAGAGAGTGAGAGAGAAGAGA